MKNVLIIAAHPDDEVLGCGGTIARLSMEGNSVYTLILGEGVTSRDEYRDRAKREGEIEKLKREAQNAGKVLNVKKTYIFDFPDNRFDSIPILDIIKVIERIKGEVNPDIVFTHHHGDLNIDHQITCRAALTACRPYAGERLREIYSFEVPSSTEWNAPTAASYFIPDYFVDISNSLDKKIEALKEYETETREYPHPRSPEALDISARQWGIKVGLEAAEAFKVIRIIR